MRTIRVSEFVLGTRLLEGEACPGGAVEWLASGCGASEMRCVSLPTRTISGAPPAPSSEPGRSSPNAERCRQGSPRLLGGSGYVNRLGANGYPRSSASCIHSQSRVSTRKPQCMCQCCLSASSWCETKVGRQRLPPQ